jgi:hypothetical protein
MMDNIDDLAESHLKALWVLEKEKLMVAGLITKELERNHSNSGAWCGK